MEIKIKDYIINNFKNDNKETLKKAINESINEQDEVVLPGLGVFLSLIWQGMDDNEKEKTVNILYSELRKKESYWAKLNTQ